MESQPQNPEFRTKPENFHLSIKANPKGKIFSNVAST